MVIMLQSMDPTYPKIETFHKQIRAGVTPPSQSQAQEIIRRNDAQELFRLAEQCMCFGKSQVGQKILTHLLQREALEGSARKLGTCAESLYSTFAVGAQRRLYLLD